MRKPLILITGATGKTGAATITQLLAQGYPVRALTRCADDRSERLRKAGAEVVVGSLEDATDLRKAMSGVQRAYYCPPLEAGTLRRATLFAVVALESRLEAVVAMSQWLADASHPAIHAREKWLSEKVFQWTPGLDVVTINPGFFADNYMLALEPIAHFGLMAMPLGDGLNAPPSNEDIARVIVGALVNPAPYVGKTYRPTGPKLLAPEEIATIIGRVLGRKVKYQNVPIQLFLKVAKSLKIDDFVLEELYWFLHDYQRNSFGVGAPTSAVLDVGGVDAESFEVTVQRYVAGSAFRNRTFGSTLSAIYNLLAGLLTPAPNPESIAIRLKLPALNHPSLAADSASWLASHAMDCAALPSETSP
ncbi:MAG: NmrA family NAD(P)-binding protein [Terracidiphilus sp.]